MLRQLADLTRRVPAAGPRALAVAVYARGDGELVRASENGIEGVACVDDAARAFVLLSELWRATGNAALRAWADGLLEFVHWMRAGGGRWFNFIYDWDGTQNTAGITSKPGFNFWQARATCALVDACLVLEDQTSRESLKEALAAAASAPCPADVRSLHTLAAVRLLDAEPDPWLAAQVVRWCDAMAGCRSGDMLMNSPDERGLPHLWGHVQEAALVEAAALLGRDDLRKIAIRSAEGLFTPIIQSGFDLPHVQPYDVQSAVFVMDHLAAVTGDQRYVALAQAARGWFDGRNPAAARTYDRAKGRVADGIDHGRINDHSGAEANITAGLALVEDPSVLEIARNWVGRPAHNAVQAGGTAD